MRLKIGFLTCENRPELFEKEQKLIENWKKRPKNTDIEAEVLIWSDPNVDWKSYDFLVFRSIWDYFEQPEKFDAWLQNIKRWNIKTLNAADVIARNQHKFYLRDLAEKGVDIIPTEFIPKGSGLDLSFLAQRGWSKAIIKPAVSGGAYLTKLFDATTDLEAVLEEYLPISETRDLLVQPFLPQIKTDGEISLLFFGGNFSHAVVKTPKSGDFRIQVQYGGQYLPFAADKNLIETAQNVVRTFADALLYARVDGVMDNGKFLLMELELIEPDLYFGQDPEAESRFFDALDEAVGIRT